MKDRVKKVDVNKLSNERVDEISKQITNKFQKLIDEMELSMADANKMFNVYGIEVKMEMAFYNKQTGEKLQ